MATQWSALYFYDAKIQCFTHQTLQDLIQNTFLKNWKPDELEKILEWTLLDPDAKIWIDCGTFRLMIVESSVDLTNDEIIESVKNTVDFHCIRYEEIIDDASVYDEDEEFNSQEYDD